MPYARISFADNGIGFDQKEAERIFQMFYRIHPDRYPGSGIGLTISKKIAELHGGFMTADSVGKKRAALLMCSCHSTKHRSSPKTDAGWNIF